MRRQFWKRWLTGMVVSLRRFPVGLVMAIMAAVAAVWLNQRGQWKLSEAGEGQATRILLLWPFALYGSAALRLRCERLQRTAGWSQIALAVLLTIGWFLLPARPQDVQTSFWFGYAAAVVACLLAAAWLPARRARIPTIWDAGWPMLQATFMAALSALIVAGGVNLALFSVVKLFSWHIHTNRYFDVLLISLFFIAPLTAFTWLPRPFGSEQELPGWVKGAVRLLLTPLALLYALILYAYALKIVLAARWPDGWVAMPTFIFAVLGLVIYLVVRTASDRHGKRWTTVISRILPLVLLPLTILLLTSMRVRITAYGFTEWRALGALLGLWLLCFALVYTARPRLSVWWMVASLVLFALIATVGPARLSRHSQALRLERRLEELGVWEKEPDSKLTIETSEWSNLRSIVYYLLRYHGAQALPARVYERWSNRDLNSTEPDQIKKKPLFRPYIEADNVMCALGLVASERKASRWMNITCDPTPIKLGADWSEVVFIMAGATNQLPFRLDNQLRLWDGETQVAADEQAAFMQRLAENGMPTTGYGQVPPDQMAYNFQHGGRAYRLQFIRLSGHLDSKEATRPGGLDAGNTLLFIGQ